MGLRHEPEPHRWHIAGVLAAVVTPAVAHRRAYHPSDGTPQGSRVRALTRRWHAQLSVRGMTMAAHWLLGRQGVIRQTDGVQRAGCQSDGDDPAATGRRAARVGGDEPVW